jgi:hypothetical protein
VATSYPFFFFGQGFGTSYKCVEGYLWFERAPRTADRKRIVELLPRPVLLGARIQGCLMHFGSDDRLESFVKAAYSPKYTKMGFEKAVEALEALWSDGSEAYIPTRREWTAFNDHFESAVKKIHRIAKLYLVIKPDDGEYGRRLGAWHRWSVKNAAQVAERGLSERGKVTKDLSYLAANLVQDVIRDGSPRMPLEERKAWLAWLDRVVAEGDRDVRESFIGQATDLVTSAPKTAQSELFGLLRASTRRQIVATEARFGKKWTIEPARR